MASRPRVAPVDRPRQAQAFEQVAQDGQGHSRQTPSRKILARKARVAAPPAVRRVPELILVSLMAFVLLSGGLALMNGMWELQLAADSLLAIYVSWLLEAKHRRSERRRKVTSLQAARRVRAPEPLRVAAGGH